jgi:hypothetical protein
MVMRLFLSDAEVQGRAKAPSIIKVEVPAGWRDLLRQAATDTDRSVSAVVRTAISEYLARLTTPAG